LLSSSISKRKSQAERERGSEEEEMLFDPKGTKWVLYGTLLIWALAFFVIGFRTAHDQTASDGIDLQHDKRDIEPNIDAEEGDDAEKDDEGGDDDDDGSADHDDDEEDDKDDLDDDEVDDDVEEHNERRKKSYIKKNKLAKS
jgi:hypothetical protein